MKVTRVHNRHVTMEGAAGRIFRAYPEYYNRDDRWIVQQWIGPRVGSTGFWRMVRINTSRRDLLIATAQAALAERKALDDRIHHQGVQS